MKTFLEALSDFKTITNDTSTGNDTLGIILLNQGSKKYLSSSDWTFNKGIKTYATGTSVQIYDIPYNAAKVDYLHYWYGGVWYTPVQIRNKDEWRRINSVSVTSSIMTHYLVDEESGDIEVYPISDDASGTIELGFTKKIRNLGLANYSTGSVSASSGSTKFTISGGTWNSKMTGRFIQVGGTNTSIDDYWFEIMDASSGSLTVKESIPVTITTATGTYVISEGLPFPDGYEDLPMVYALKRYYQQKEKLTIAREYEKEEDILLGNLMKRDQRSVQGVLTKGDGNYPDVNSNSWAIEITE